MCWMWICRSAFWEWFALNKSRIQLYDSICRMYVPKVLHFERWKSFRIKLFIEHFIIHPVWTSLQLVKLAANPITECFVLWTDGNTTVGWFVKSSVWFANCNRHLPWLKCNHNCIHSISNGIFILGRILCSSFSWSITGNWDSSPKIIYIL